MPRLRAVRALSCLLLAAPPLLAQSVKPERIAIGMIQTNQLPSVAVEITSDGWVRLDLIATRVEGVQAPSMRLLVEPRDVRNWATRVRTMMKTPRDTTTAPQPILLGNGNYQLNATHSYNTTRDEVHFAWRACGSGWGSSSPSRAELAQLVDLLDSAAVEAGGGFARPPTLKDPYYAMEVSCPASSKRSHWLPFPAGASPRDRVATEIGVRYVVDTSGRIENGSMRFLAGTPAVFSRAATAAMRSWRHRPAEIDGAPVRQVVQTTLIFSDVVPLPVNAAREMTFVADADGWVHLQHRPGDFGRAADVEWFAPDSVDAFLRRLPRLRFQLDSARKRQQAEIDSMRRQLQSQFDSVSRLLARSDSTQRARMMRDSARIRSNLEYTARRVPATGDVSAVLGAPRGGRLVVTEQATATGSRQTTSFRGCAGSGMTTSDSLSAAQLARLAAAAREARARRPTPVAPRARIHTAPHVSCPAWLTWSPAQRAGFARVWRYPTGLYPESMAATNDRAEVLVSVVVDTAGVADPETAVIMSESDPRAVAAVPATLRALRFTSALRSGVTVAQRVIQTIRFEPPPTCRVPEASPACLRRYRDEH